MTPPRDPLYSGYRYPAEPLAVATNGTLTVCHEHISEVGNVELYER
jgi:hypothetical protein